MERDLIKQYETLTSTFTYGGTQLTWSWTCIGTGAAITLHETNCSPRISLYAPNTGRDWLLLPVSDYFWDINNITEEETQLFLIDTSKWFNKHQVSLKYPTNLRLLMQAVMKP